MSAMLPVEFISQPPSSATGSAPRPNFERYAKGVRRWIWRHQPQMELQGTPDVSSGSVIEAILINRGFSAQAIDQFLSSDMSSLHDPFQLKDMDRAAARLALAIKRKEQITIYGDYDADGTTATALLVRLVEDFEGKANFYIPHRIEQGYGLHSEAMRELQAAGTQLLVTVDTGISAIEAARTACKLGLDLIITDHHQPGNELPEALAVVNPNRVDCSSATPGLAGVGVAYKLAHGTLKHLGTPPAAAKAFLNSVLELVAIGSVADFAPLIGENRLLVKRGLRNLSQTTSEGLKALLKRSGFPLGTRPVTSSEITFQVGPRINAAGRTSTAQVCVELLTSRDPARCQELAEYLENQNQERRRLETTVLKECLEILESRPELAQGPVVVLSSPSWHPGVVGIVAARLLQRLWKPVLVLSEDGKQAKGSARSIPAYNIFVGLQQCAGFLEKFGGHPAAAGLTMQADRIDQLRKTLCAHAESLLRPQDLIPCLSVDAVVNLDQVDESLVEGLNLFQPTGQGNPEPMLAAFEVELGAQPRVIKEKHWKLQCQSPSGRALSAMGWNLVGDDEGLSVDTKRVDMIFRPVISTFTGELELQLHAVRPSWGKK